MSTAAERHREWTLNSFAYQIAGALILAMSKTGLLPSNVDARLEWKPGTTQAIIVRLLDHQDGELRPIAEICWALGHIPRLSLDEVDPEILLAQAGLSSAPTSSGKGGEQ